MSEFYLSTQQMSKFPQLPAKKTMERWMKSAIERDTSVTVRFVDEEEGRMLNNTYRHKDYATNVLTFDYTQEPEVTADIVICVPVMERQEAQHNKN